MRDSGDLCGFRGVYGHLEVVMREEWDLCVRILFYAGLGFIEREKRSGGSVLRLLDVVVHDEFVFEQFVG